MSALSTTKLAGLVLLALLPHLASAAGKARAKAWSKFPVRLYYKGSTQKFRNKIWIVKGADSLHEKNMTLCEEGNESNTEKLRYTGLGKFDETTKELNEVFPDLETASTPAQPKSGYTGRKHEVKQGGSPTSYYTMQTSHRSKLNPLGGQERLSETEEKADKDPKKVVAEISEAEARLLKNRQEALKTRFPLIRKVKWKGSLASMTRNDGITVDLKFIGGKPAGEKWTKMNVPIDANLKSVGGKHHGGQTTEDLNTESADLPELARRRLGWKPSHDIPHRREGFHHSAATLVNRVLRESERQS